MSADLLRVLCATASIPPCVDPRIHHQWGDVYIYRGPVLLAVRGATVAVDAPLEPPPGMVALLAPGDDGRPTTGLRARLIELLGGGCACAGTLRDTCHVCEGTGIEDHDCGCPHCPPGRYTCGDCEGDRWLCCARTHAVRIIGDVFDAHLLHAVLPEEPTHVAVRTNAPPGHDKVRCLVAWGDGWAIGVAEMKDAAFDEVEL